MDIAEIPAEKLYEDMLPHRQAFDRQAERAASFSIPSLIPPDGGRRYSQDLPTPRQGLVARGVNHLSARHMLALMPANQPFFRYMLHPFMRDAIAEPEKQAEFEKFLSKREDSVHLEVTKRGIRPKMTEAIKHLVVGGTVLFYFGSDGFRWYPLKRFTLALDSESDEWKTIVVKETVALRNMAPDVRELAEQVNAGRSYHGENSQPQIGNAGDDAEADIYTKAWRDGDRVYWRQEFSTGDIIPGTESDVPKERDPWQPVPWSIVEGKDYGRGHVEDAIGDIMNLESLSGALVEGALSSARMVGLVSPNGQTMPEDLNNARNGEFVPGREEDIKFLQVDKFADFRSAQESMMRIEERLKAHFLLSSIRDSERTTAQEVQLAQRELDSAQAGQFSTFAQKIQLPLATIIAKNLEDEGTIPKIPAEFEEAIYPVVVTGVEALGRATDLERFEVAGRLMQLFMSPEQMSAELNMGPIATSILTAASVKVEGVQKSEEDKQAERQAAQQAQMAQTALEKGIGPGINALAAQGGGEAPEQ